MPFILIATGSAFVILVPRGILQKGQVAAIIFLAGFMLALGVAANAAAVRPTVSSVTTVSSFVIVSLLLKRVVGGLIRV